MSCLIRGIVAQKGPSPFRCRCRIWITPLQSTYHTMHWPTQLRPRIGKSGPQHLQAIHVQAHSLQGDELQCANTVPDSRGHQRSIPHAKRFSPPPGRTQLVGTHFQELPSPTQSREGQRWVSSRGENHAYLEGIPQKYLSPTCRLLLFWAMTELAFLPTLALSK
jgi:hypothetical protein